MDQRTDVGGDAGVYPICFEELALTLAHQPGFGFPFWNSATICMDIQPLCTRYVKPTLAYAVQAVRGSFRFLRECFSDFDCVFFDSVSKVDLGIHRPCQGLYLRGCTDLAQTSASLMKGFTANRAIRRTCDLARPM